MRSVLKKGCCVFVVLCLLCSVCCVAVAQPAGDANGDGVFNAKDVLAARKYVAGLDTPFDETAADINRDSIVNMKDVLLLRLMLAGYAVGEDTTSTAENSTTNANGSESATTDNKTTSSVWANGSENGVSVTTATVTTTAKPTTTTKKPTTTAKPTTTTTNAGPFSKQQQKILTLVNEERAKAGLKPVVLNEKACAAANVRATEVPILFDHSRLDGRSSFTALDEAGVQYIAAGENIAKGYLTAEDVMKGWMDSEGHRANILTPGFTHIGVGYDKASHSWVQLFYTAQGASFEADPAATKKMNEALFKEINKVRVANGLSAFTTSEALNRAAETLADEQGKMGKMSFTRPDGRKYSTVLEENGISFHSVNNHVGFRVECKTLEDALELWAPGGDYALWLDGSYTSIGIGYDETTGYWSILTLN